MSQSMASIPQPKAPLVPDEALGGYTIAQVSAFTGYSETTVFEWTRGIRMNGVELKLDTFYPDPPTRPKLLVKPAEWQRFWASYLAARQVRRPRGAKAVPPQAVAS